MFLVNSIPNAIRKAMTKPSTNKNNGNCDGVNSVGKAGSDIMHIDAKHLPASYVQYVIEHVYENNTLAPHITHICVRDFDVHLEGIGSSPKFMILNPTVLNKAKENANDYSASIRDYRMMSASDKSNMSIEFENGSAAVEALFKSEKASYQVSHAVDKKTGVKTEFSPQTHPCECDYTKVDILSWQVLAARNTSDTRLGFNIGYLKKNEQGEYVSNYESTVSAIKVVGSKPEVVHVSDLYHPQTTYSTHRILSKKSGMKVNEFLRRYPNLTVDNVTEGISTLSARKGELQYKFGRPEHPVFYLLESQKEDLELSDKDLRSNNFDGKRYLTSPAAIVDAMTECVKDMIKEYKNHHVDLNTLHFEAIPMDINDSDKKPWNLSVTLRMIYCFDVPHKDAHAFGNATSKETTECACDGAGCDECVATTKTDTNANHEQSDESSDDDSEEENEQEDQNKKGKNNNKKP